MHLPPELLAPCHRVDYLGSHEELAVDLDVSVAPKLTARPELEVATTQAYKLAQRDILAAGTDGDVLATPRLRLDAAAGVGNAHAHAAVDAVEPQLDAIVLGHGIDGGAQIHEAAGAKRIYASHKSVMFSRRSCYFFVRPKRTFLEVCVFLGRVLKAPQVRRVDRTSKSKIVHVIPIRHRDEVEEPITGWLREAYELSDVLASNAGRSASTGQQGPDRSRRKRPSGKALPQGSQNGCNCKAVSAHRCCLPQVDGQPRTFIGIGWC